MGGGKNSGQANASGMYEAMSSAEAADKAYAMGEDQLAWAKQQWGQQQPLVKAITDSLVTTQKQQADFSQEQENLYKSTYEPLEKSYAKQAEQWASPAQQKLNAASAETNVHESAEAGRTAAQQQLEGYGINPGSTRFAGLDIGSRTMEAAAAAGAGTTAAQATKLQGLGLESGVVNTGRGMPNTVAGLAGAGIGAGTAGSGVMGSNLTTGANAMSSGTAWTNAGTGAMNTYTNAVNGYNQAQLGYAQVGAQQSSGFGSMLGSLAGSAMGMFSFEDGGPTDDDGPAIPPQNGATPGAIPAPLPNGATPGGAIPPHASPSMGAATDDVPARLTAGEFVVPKDVVAWEGQKYFYNQIDKSRQAKQEASARTDIGGQRSLAPPAAATFTSRPQQPQPQQGSGAIPPRQLAQRRAVG